MNTRALLLPLFLLGCSRDGTTVADAAVAPTAHAAIERAVTIARHDAELENAFARSSFEHANGAFAIARDRAVAPRFADGSFSVRSPDHAPVTLRTRGLRGHEGELVSGRIGYADVAPSTDLLAASFLDRLELFYLLGDETAPHHFALDFVLPEGVTLRAESEGSIAIDDAHGTFLRIPRAYAVDAHGVRREATLSIEGGAVVVDLDTHDLAYPVLLDPAIDQVQWTDLSPVSIPPYTGTSSSVRVTPPAGWARTYGSMAYGDAGSGGRMWLFGGTYVTSSNPPWQFAGQLFEWNGSTWTARGSSYSYGFGPVDFTQRVGNIAYDSARKKVVWIGGYIFGPSGAHVAAAEFDPIAGSWAKTCDDGSPCYDTMPDVGGTPSVVYAFGKTVVVYTNGTSTWDPVGGKLVKWALPTDFARSGPGLAYDSDRNIVVAFGGTGGQNDTWELDGTTWSAKTVASPPPGTATPVLAYDSARKRTLLFTASSSMYEWDGSTWTAVSVSGAPSGRSGAAFGYDAARGRLLAMGGHTANLSNAGDPSSSNPCFDKAPTTYHDFNKDYRYCNKLDFHTGLVFGGDCSATRPCDAGTYCVDGVCCTTSCASSCQRCVAPGKVGSCVSVVSATDPDTCTGTSTCSAAGVCGKLNGQACTAGNECLSNNCIDGVCCNVACGGACEACNITGKVGTCTPLAKGSAGKGCGSFTCSGTSGACATTCTTDVDCAGSAYCEGGTCKPAQAVGAVCARDRQCTGGRCSDGVCCGAPCDGPCDVCSKALGATADGTCTNLPATAAPAGCGGFACSGTSGACATSCTVDADCAATAWCNSGSCVVKKAQGQSCDRTAQCSSGLACADGVCCNEACDGTCRACSAVNKASGDKSGECGAAREHTNPNAKCVKEDVTTCGLTGECDGAGACAKYPAGAGCGPTGSTTCDAGVVKGQTCDGLGSCRIDMTGTSCAPGACKDGACAWTCGDDSGCASTAWCDAGLCRAKGIPGQKCAAHGQCASGHCADGVCCNVACTGSCEACDVEGTRGTCTPVSGTPHMGHPACPAADPSNACSALSCDGIDRNNCARRAGSEVTCREASCAAEVATLSATCDGSGACPAAITQSCQPYACGDVKCKTSCTADSDCKSGFVCDVKAGACTGGASCGPDGSVTRVDGTKLECAPYACEATGNCKTSCSVSEDCIAPAICSGSVCAVPDGSTGESGGCATSRGTGASTLAMLALVLLGRLKRRRAA
jgi:hypothetical protein